MSFTPTVQTGQIWKHKKRDRRIRVLNCVGPTEHDDWRYETIPNSGQKRSTGLIFGWNIQRFYDLEKETDIS